MDLQDAITRMQHLVLSWDYFEMFDDSRKTDKSDDVKGDLKRKQARELVSVPNSFTSVEHYISIFEPLLLEECSANIVRGCMEGEYAKVHKTIIAKIDEVDEWTYGRMTLEAGVNEEFRTSNLVLLSKDHPDQYNARRELHALGLAESREGAASVRIKFYLDLSAQAGNEIGEKRMKLMKEKMVYKSDWWICVLASLSTNFREWTALQNIRSLPFRNVLFSAQPAAKKANKLMEIAPAMKKKISIMYNKSQNDALQAGLDGTPVVLIQGPPGTGKTHAILGLLGIILHAMQKGSLELVAGSEDDEMLIDEPWEESGLWSDRAPWLSGRQMPRDSSMLCWDSAEDSDPNDDCYGLLDYSTPMVIGKQHHKSARVLVCAPSNSALDEIVHRIIYSGLMDNDGNFYHPSIVRVGVSVHHSVQSVHLETLMEERLKSKTGLSYFEKDRIRSEIIDEADIVASTLSYSGTNLFKKFGSKFNVVVVDEAAQAVETQLLIPLMNGARQVYMVGDPIQLPATVLSDRARKFEYNKSCFKRLMNAGYPVHMLNVQYRMNPAISAFPSQEFYDGKLLDDESVIESTRSVWHEHPSLGPLTFYNVEGKEEKLDDSMSTLNRAEVNLVVALFRELTNRYPALKTGTDIAIISPYKAQVKEFRKVFQDTFGEETAQNVDVNSIDGFQGRQKDITFFSTVRSKEAKHVGFVADEHRINVAITRARCSLIIVGDGKVLMEKDECWRRLILSAKSNGCYYNAQRPFPIFVNKVINGEIAPEGVMEHEQQLLDKCCKGESVGMQRKSEEEKPAMTIGRESKVRGSGGRGRGRSRGRRGRGSRNTRKK